MAKNPKRVQSVDIGKVQKAAARAKGIRVKDLVGHNRRWPSVDARYVAIAICCESIPLQNHGREKFTRKLAEKFNRKPGLIWWARNQTKKWLETDKKFRALYETAKHILNPSNVPSGCKVYKD